MKYEINRICEKEVFKPFKIILTFETKEEYVNFHDNVMSKITKVESHNFHRDLYRMGCGNTNSCSGKI